MINSFFEEIICIFLMAFIIVFHLEDKLYKLTFNVLNWYMAWFLITSSIVKILEILMDENNKRNEIIKLLVSISYLIRAYFMFYLYVR